MRLIRLTALALLALVALDWAPGLPPYPSHVASAQTTFPIIGPGGFIDYGGASATCVNTAASCSLYNASPVPVALYATSPATNLTGGAKTPLPLHLVLRGTINTTSGGQTGSVNAGASFGPGATIALLNGHTPPVPGAGLSTAPIQIDVWWQSLASGTLANTGTLSGRVAYAAASGTETVINSFVLGTSSVFTPEDLNVEWRWGSANNINAITIYNRTLQIGN